MRRYGDVLNSVVRQVVFEGVTLVKDSVQIREGLHVRNGRHNVRVDQAARFQIRNSQLEVGNEFTPPPLRSNDVLCRMRVEHEAVKTTNRLSFDIAIVNCVFARGQLKQEIVFIAQILSVGCRVHEQEI